MSSEQSSAKPSWPIVLNGETVHAMNVLVRGVLMLRDHHEGSHTFQLHGQDWIVLVDEDCMFVRRCNGRPRTSLHDLDPKVKSRKGSSAASSSKETPGSQKHGQQED